jgi:hypothetical protein
MLYSAQPGDKTNTNSHWLINMHFQLVIPFGMMQSCLPNRDEWYPAKTVLNPSEGMTME